MTSYAAASPPPQPLVVVLGSTGTGKSDLAVDLATRFGGEVVNADAMQMYQGLPIITNKISPEERRGIPHHLLGIIGLDEPTWNVHRFRREAARIVRDVHARGRLPILVGGTHYYLDGLLFDNHLVSAASPPPESASDSGSEGEKGNEDEEERRGTGTVPRDSALDEASTESLMAQLREVDPVSADRWHPRDRRKILRSLEIYLTTGRRASDIYAEQERTRRQRPPPPPWQPLFFWVHSDRAVLNARLDRRVDRMMDGGLVAETREMHALLHRAGAAVDRTTGIWQSIGFGEIEPYLDALSRREQGAGPAGDGGDAELEALRAASVALIKQSNRRYAKGQVRWIANKTLPLVRDAGMLARLFVVDSTDAARWAADVADVAAGITERYLAGRPLPDPASVSAAAAEVLAAAAAANGRSSQATPCNKTCQVCGTTALTEEKWLQHIRGNRHRRATKAANKRALVAFYLESKAARDAGSETGQDDATVDEAAGSSISAAA